MCVFHLSPSSLGRSEQEDDSSSQARVGLRDSVSVCWPCSSPHRISCLRMAGSYGLMSNFKCTCPAHNHTLFNWGSIHTLTFWQSEILEVSQCRSHLQFAALTFIILETSQMQTLPLLVAAARNCGQLPKLQQAILSELSGLFGNWAGLVASVTDSGTFCVCSPFTNGQLGECRSCSDLGSSGEMLLSLISKFKNVAQLFTIRLNSPKMLLAIFPSWGR